MTPLPSKIGELLVKFVANVLGGPKTVLRCIAIASLSLAEYLLSLINQGFIKDINRVKESLIRKMEADADSAVADAQKKLAEAAEASNRANLPKRKDALAKAKKEIAQAKVAKTQAESEAIRKNAETQRLLAIAEARARFLEALAKLRQEDGDIFFNIDNLKRILEEGLPPEDYEANSEPDSDK